jgi:hypothetical protein
MPYRPGCCGGLEYFPELNGLVLANGDSGLLHYDPAANRWSEISGASWGDYHNFAEYSAVHRLMIFGGGEGAGGSVLFRLDAHRQIARLNDAPRRMGTTHSVVTVDPVGGNFLVFFDDASYEFNPLTEVWAPLPSVPPWLSLGAPGIFNVVATPISDYGVVLVAKYAGDDSRVYLYRHRPSAPAPGLDLSANPATVDAGGSSTLSWTSTNSTQCTGSGGTNAWPGSKSVPSGSESVGPIQVRTIFGLSCAGAGGAIQRFVAVDVSQPGGSTGNSSGGGGSLGLLALLSLGGALARRGFARA